MNSPPLETLIANVNVVPRAKDQWIIIRLEDGSWEVPGGTLEAGEDFLAAACRELLEEAGAKLVDWSVIGAWHCHSLASRPHRPHLPFPESYRLVLLGEVEITHPPANPVSGERVIQVGLVSLDMAVSRFRSICRPDLAELYLLASDLSNKGKLRKNS